MGSMDSNIGLTDGFESENDNKYIEQLLEDVEVYTTFPKPRGKGGARNINRMSDEILRSFIRLSKMGRIDIVAKVMCKFADVRDILKPVSFDTWMGVMSSDLTSDEVLSLFHTHRYIFEKWLDREEMDDSTILEVAQKIAIGHTREEFMEFRNFVVDHIGKIEGLDACFQATSRNTENQILLDSETVNIELDYIYIEGYLPISIFDIHLLTTSKIQGPISVRLLKCEINGLQTSNCGFGSEMDEEPRIGYHVFDMNGEPLKDELSIYTDFFEVNDINEVQSITLHFIIMDDDGNVIEEVSDAVIELDDNTGEYKVTQQAASMGYVADRDNGYQDSEFEIAGSGEQASENGFEDITIYDDEEVYVDFCGVEFDSLFQKLSLNIWCRNKIEENRRFWMKDITVNLIYPTLWKLIGEGSEGGSFFKYVLPYANDDSYENIKSIEFQIEIDNDDDEEIGKSDKVVLFIDLEDETYNTLIM